MRWGSVVVALALVAGCAGDPCSGGETVCVDDHTIRRCMTKEDGFAVSYEWGEPEACYAVNPFCVTRDDIGANVTPQSHGLCAADETRLVQRQPAVLRRWQHVQVHRRLLGAPADLHERLLRDHVRSVIAD
jgi:hypothetical protein